MLIAEFVAGTFTEPALTWYAKRNHLGTIVALIFPAGIFDRGHGPSGIHRDFKNSMMASCSSLFSFSN